MSTVLQRLFEKVRPSRWGPMLTRKVDANLPYTPPKSVSVGFLSGLHSWVWLCLFTAGSAMVSQQALAQASSANYTFATSNTGSLALDANSNTVDMTTGTTQLVAGAQDATASAITPIGFNYVFMGSLYTQFSASADGYVGLGGTVVSGTTMPGTVTTPKLAAMGGDLYTGATGGKVHYKVVGTAPNRCLVVEFANMAVYYSTTAGNAINNYQIRLYETTGLFECAYGTMYCGSTSFPPGYVGFSLGSVLNLQASVTTSTNTVSTGATFNTNTYTAATNIANLNSAANGSRRMYTFTPPVTAPSAPISASFTSIGSAGMTVNWVDNSSTEVAFTVLRSTDNITFTPVSTVASTTTAGTGTAYSSIQSGLTPSTTYYWQIVALNEGRASTALTGTQATTGPQTVTATANGGLWSSGATWVGGLAPSSVDDAVIPTTSIVTIDAATTITNVSVTGTLQWGSASVALTALGNITINSGGNFVGFGSAGGGQTINVLGNFTNNGTANLIVSALNFAGTGTQTLGGSGTYVGNGSRGLVASVQMQGSGTLNIAVPLNIRTLNPLIGSITGGANIELDNNKAQVFNQPAINGSINNVVITAMGSALTAAPSVFGATMVAWSNITGTLNTLYFSGANVYRCTAAANIGPGAPVHTSGVAQNLLWIGTVGSLGNPFLGAQSHTAGTQYFYGNNLYTCTVTGVASIAAPPVHVTGTAVSNLATFQYVGTVCQVSLTYDATTQTVRKATVTSAGSGYSNGSPTAVLFNNGTGTLPTIAVLGLPAVAGPLNTLVQKVATATISGTPTINTAQGISVPTTTTGGRYATAPTVGFSYPSALNYMLLSGASGGTGYTGAPTIAFAGGTINNGGTAITFTATIAGGKIINLIPSGGTATYSSPPTSITFTGGTFTTAATSPSSAALAAIFPTATAVLNANGQLVNFTVTNAGSGYIVAPTIALGAAGVGEVAATTPTCRVALYNLTASFFAASAVNGVTPTTVNGVHNESTNLAGLVPSSRQINVLSSGTSQGINFTGGNLVLLNSAPLTLGGGPIDMGGSDLEARHYSYAGQSSTSVSWIQNGSFTSNYVIASQATAASTRTFPFRATGATGAVQLLVGVGAGIGTGSDVSRVRVTQVGASTGTATGVSPVSANMIGTVRSFKVDILSGTAFGATTLPTLVLGYDASDNPQSDAASLYVAQSNTGLSSGWALRSATSGTGALPATGTRTTATTSNGPIVFGSTMYFSWASTFVVPAALNFTVSRTTGNAYQSIFPVVTGGDGTGGSQGGNGTGVAFTYSSTSGDEALSNVVPSTFTTFTYQGALVTGFRIGGNGYMNLINANAPSATLGTSDWNNRLTGITGVNVLAPFYEDLTFSSGNGGTTGGQVNCDASLRYYISGAVGAKKIIVEWNNLTFYAKAGPELYFQVVLDETDNSITYKYGNMQLFNGTQDLRWSYTTGLSGAFIQATPAAGQVFQQQFENTTQFSHEMSIQASIGANGLGRSPDPRSSIKFVPVGGTPGTAGTAPAVPTPANDNVGGAVVLTPLTSFPTNIAWNTALGKSNYYTVRGASTSPQTICGGSATAKDVWFRFTALDPNTTVRIYGSGGFIPRVEILDASLAPWAPVLCNVGTQGLTVDASATNLIPGDTYYVRVYNSSTGTLPVGTATVSGGAVTGLSLSNLGAGINSCVSAFGYTNNNLTIPVSFEGGGGTNAVGVATVATPGTQSALTGVTYYGGNNYVSAPTVVFGNPDWGITGEFGIIVYAAAPNDNCSTASLITSPGNGQIIAPVTRVGSTNGSTTVTLTTGTTTGLVGGNVMVVSGANIPANATIVSITNATQFVISAAATGSGAGLTFTFNRNQYTAILTGAATASSEAVCIGLADDDVWYRFVATATKHNIIVTGSGAFDPAVQVWDGINAGGDCVGKTALAGQCVNATGAGGTENLALTGLTIGRSYFVRLYHGGVGTSFGNSVSISIYTPLPLQYQFAQTSGSYTAITGGTVLASGVIDDAVYTVSGLSPAAVFNTLNFSTLQVSSNGFIQFGTAAASTSNYIPLTTLGGDGVASACGNDLEDAAGAAEIRYELVGSEYVFQWSGMRRKTSTGQSLNFQIRLNTSTGDVVYVYGPGTAGSVNLGFGVTVGLRTELNTAATFTGNPTVATPFYQIRRTTLIAPANQVFDQTTTGSAGTASNISPTSFPTSGLTFTYSNTSCNPGPDPVTATDLTESSVTVKWRKVAGSLGYDVYYRKNTDAVSVATYQTASPTGSALDTDTTLSLTGLSSAQVYVFDVRAKCGAAANQKSHRGQTGVFTTPGPPISYAFTQSTGTYTPITGGTIVVDNATDLDELVYTVPLGASTIEINGVPYNSVEMSTNGFLTAGGNSTTSTYTGVTQSFGTGAVCPYGADLDQTASLAGEIRWQDVGAEVVFQWKNFNYWLGTGQNLDFQARYNKTTKVWNIVYGGAPNFGSGATAVQMGIKSAGVVHGRDYIALKATNDLSKMTTAPAASTTNTSSATLFPTQGLTYTFTPVTTSYYPDSAGVTQGVNPLVLDKTFANSVRWNRIPVTGSTYASSAGYKVRWRKVADAESVTSWASPITAGTTNADTAYNITGLDPGSAYVAQAARIVGGTEGGFSPVIRFTTLPADYDLEFTTVTLPNSSVCFTNSNQVTVRLTSRGTLAVAAGQVINVSMTVTTPGGPVNLTAPAYTVGANITLNGFVDVPVGTLNMSTPGSYTFNGSLTWGLDEGIVNNTLTAVTVTAVTPIVVSGTYSNGLDASTGWGISQLSGTGNWAFTTGSGGSSPVITPVEGAGFVLYNSFGFSSIGAVSRLSSPCFTLPVSCSKMQFKMHRYAGSNGGSFSQSPQEGVRVRVSTDGGATYTAPLTLTNVTTGLDTGYARRYYSQNGTPVSGLWHTFELPLTSYSGQIIKIAFDAYNEWGYSFGIDDFKILPSISNDISANTIISPEPFVTCGDGVVNVSISVQNKGCFPQSNIPYTVTAVGSVSPPSFSGVIPGPILGGQTITYSVGSLTLTSASSVDFTVTTNLVGDEVPANNATAIITVPLKVAPVVTSSVTPANVVIPATSTLAGTVALSGETSNFINNYNFGIPDNTPAGVVSSVIATGLGGLTASQVKSVTLNIQHAANSNLTIILKAPDGTQVTLVSNGNLSGSNITDCIIGTTGGVITSGSAPYNGTYTPVNPLSGLGAGPANGTWELNVVDGNSFSYGSILNWRLTFDNGFTSVLYTCATCPFSQATTVFNPYPSATNANVTGLNPLSFPAGTYDINLSATDRQGCTTSLTKTVGFFTTNLWLGVDNTPIGNNWSNTLNWFASPNPPNSTTAVTIPAGTPFSPTVGAGTAVGSVTLNPGATLAVNTGGSLNVSSNWTGSNNSVTGAGNVTFTGTSGQSITGNTFFNNLTLNKTSGTTTVNGIANVTGTLTIANTTSPLTVAPTGKLVLVSNASGTGRIAAVPPGAVISGNVTSQRYLSGTGDKWYFVGTPISGGNFGQWSDDIKMHAGSNLGGSQGVVPVGMQHSTIFKYDDNFSAGPQPTDTVQKRGWRVPTLADNLALGKGFRVYYDESGSPSRTLQNVGPVQVGNFNFPTLVRTTPTNCYPYYHFGTPYTPVSCDESYWGWNFLANPYPSDIDWDAASGWTKPGTMQPAWFRWNTLGNGYGVYSGTYAGTLPAPSNPNIIPSGQGFFVKLTSGATATLSATEAVKTSSSGQFARTSVAPMQLKITLTQPTTTAGFGYQGVVRFNESASDGYDPMYDISNMAGSGFYFGMLAGNQNVIINTLGIFDTDKIIPLTNAYQGTYGSFIWKFDDVETFGAGNHVYLKDNLLGVLHDVISNPVYQFEAYTANGSHMTDRFELVFTPNEVTSVSNQVGGLNFGLYPNPSDGNDVTLAISGVDAPNANVTISDVLGKVVYSTGMEILSGRVSKKDLKFSLPAGVYTVRVITEGRTFTDKLIVR